MHACAPGTGGVTERGGARASPEGILSGQPWGFHAAPWRRGGARVGRVPTQGSRQLQVSGGGRRRQLPLCKKTWAKPRASARNKVANELLRPMRLEPVRDLSSLKRFAGFILGRDEKEGRESCALGRVNK